ncbi:hypothetical protein ACGC1H_007354 [Rhizoctonia solani]|uniref:Uncharacterized protein n=1 Tax=Rhizoctonia solani TaxID=456999 RepID=A0A8H3GKD2_9AGAM|nr:unnamed protein product [Rhizoctonia solani]
MVKTFLSTRPPLCLFPETMATTSLSVWPTSVLSSPALVDTVSAPTILMFAALSADIAASTSAAAAPATTVSGPLPEPAAVPTATPATHGKPNRVMVEAKYDTECDEEAWLRGLI